MNSTAANSELPTSSYPPSGSINTEQHHPSTSTNAAVSTPGNGSLPPAMTVRLGVMRRIFLATTGMDRRRRWRLGFTTLIGGGQVIAFIVILATSYKGHCDQNLKLYLILLIVRISLAFPTALWTAITPRHSRRDTPERREELERNRLLGSQRIDRRVKKLSDLVSLYGLIVFLVGNIWIISSDSCSSTNPTLWKGALAGLIISWVWILEFFILCAIAVLFLPILIYGMRHWGWGEKKHEVGPLKKNDISKLPRRIFIGTISEDASNLPKPESTRDALPSSDTKLSLAPTEVQNVESSNTGAKKSRPQFWRLYRSTRSSSTNSPSSSTNTPAKPASSLSYSIADYPPFPPKTLPIKLPESQNACSICLSEYEVPPLKSSVEAAKWEPQILLLLPCGHVFCEGCLVDWLAVSGRCALCQTPVFPPKPSKTDKNSTSTTPSTPSVSTTTADTSTSDRATQTIPSGEGEAMSRNRIEDLV